MITLTINSEFDFTPKGKRAARYVRTSRGSRQLRWYVGGRLYVKGANPAFINEWINNNGATNHLPQNWEAFA